MRIACSSIDQFLENLSEEQILYQTIWVSKTSLPLNGKTRFDASSFAIGFQVSAVVEKENGDQYLLEAGEACGIDRTNRGEESTEGTDKEKGLREKVAMFCQAKSWQIKPGVIDL